MNWLLLTSWDMTGENNNPGFSIAGYLAISDVKQLLEANLRMPLLRLGRILMEGRMFKVLALFLLGIYAGRQILENNILSKTTRLKKIILWGLLIGIPMNLLRTWTEFGNQEGVFWQFAEYMLNALALTPMAIAYCAIIALIVTRRQQWLKWFAPVGRTALSNYLFQSLICIFIFYGVGLGYGGTWDMQVFCLLHWRCLRGRLFSAPSGSDISALDPWNGYGGNSPMES
jgi:uncharacterized protein